MHLNRSPWQLVKKSRYKLISINNRYILYWVEIVQQENDLAYCLLALSSKIEVAVLFARNLRCLNNLASCLACFHVQYVTPVRRPVLLCAFTEGK